MSQLQTKQNEITYITNSMNYITVNFHNFNTGMIPTRKEQEYKNPKYVDGVRPQDCPLTYNYLLLCSCLAMHPFVLFIYYNKSTQKRFSSFCYLSIPESEITYVINDLNIVFNLYYSYYICQIFYLLMYTSTIVILGNYSLLFYI